MTPIARVLGAISLLGTQAAAAAPTTSPVDPVLDGVIARAIRHPDGRPPCTFDRSAYAGDTRALPIGIFDSGIGGLTVLEAILALDAFQNDTLHPGPDGRPDFERERFVYLGDQANMPYGNYPRRGKGDYLRELILKDAVFLLGNRFHDDPSAPVRFTKPPVKAIVIACNTATAYGLEDVRAAIRAWGLAIPVIGVVEAGARGVLDGGAAESGGTVAVLATVGTCASGAYPRAIGRATALAGRAIPAVIQRGCVGLAGAIEGDPAFIAGDDSPAHASPYRGPHALNRDAPILAERMHLYGFDKDGLLGDPSDPRDLRLNSPRNYARYDVASLVEEYRLSGARSPIDTVVLGCTHFPLVQDEIAGALARLRTLECAGTRPYRDLVAQTIRFVNPAELVAKELFRALATSRLRLKPGESCVAPSDLFYLSVANPASPRATLTASGSLDDDAKYGRETGRLDQDDTRCVPMRPASLPTQGLNLVRRHLPNTWARLTASQ